MDPDDLSEALRAFGTAMLAVLIVAGMLYVLAAWS